ncbi:tRNA pseudouridine(55) synthase TruB [Rhizorhabdus dicambivorans]|uniref:tRNA pseudouridine synthase B n=1 Tax=Rhizorhabdus dicambivorans TaxID=1850238 RepID=A0A2A4FXL1_9SPHN|nr:tRNA pseudouridine(55) synthase TruB [Rhizorhabdus dicambivorans]ATE66920.1 tRNA pseudouridine(55) synthase TruB [Rhizorhabdus dicambivorans]PCE42210.1 tRNA pseudouridine(55) synthase TruB [Rhizorhabdus dicambivorans]
MHGWIIIDKPVGPGSTQIVSAVKRALRTGGYGKYKVGHGGTLDPLASGVLPVAIGEATKLSGRMLDADKAYDFTIGFGVETDTLDAEGKAVTTSDVRPTRAALEAVLPRFTGPIEQVPPVYSALKIDGERAYDLARVGEQVEMKTRAVTIHRLDIVDVGAAGEGDELAEGTLSCSVSKGTYIRSLARDIARALGSVGHVTMLRRTKAGPFTFAPAIPLDKLEELAKARQLEKAILPLTAGLDDIPALSVTPDQARALREGRRLIGIAAPTGLNLAIDGDMPVALVEVEDQQVRVVRGFNVMSKEDT